MATSAARPLARWLTWVAAVAAAFAWPLAELFRFAAGSGLYSHILLMPLICGYLVWLKRDSLPAADPPARTWAVVPGAAAAGLLGWRALAGTALVADDALALTTGAFVCAVWSVSLLFLGRATVKALLFPLAMLVFLVPMPVAVRDGVEMFLQHASAGAAELLFRLTGLTFLRLGLLFELPTVTLEVAPECSGIRSTLVLFITSLLAGYLFLRSGWKRAVVVAVVIPLGIFRNALRIWVLAELCVRVGPQMLHSPIHQQGGPIFFAASLLPLMGLLIWLWRTEHTP